MPTHRQRELAMLAGELTYAGRKLARAASALQSDHPAIAARIRTFLAAAQSDLQTVITDSGIQAPQPESYENG